MDLRGTLKIQKKINSKPSSRFEPSTPAKRLTPPIFLNYYFITTAFRDSERMMSNEWHKTLSVQRLRFLIFVYVFFTRSADPEQPTCDPPQFVSSNTAVSITCQTAQIYPQGICALYNLVSSLMKTRTWMSIFKWYIAAKDLWSEWVYIIIVYSPYF